MKTDLAHAGSKVSDLIADLTAVLPRDDEQRSAFMESLPENKITYLNIPASTAETKSELNVRTTMHEVFAW